MTSGLATWTSPRIMTSSWDRVGDSPCDPTAICSLMLVVIFEGLSSLSSAILLLFLSDERFSSGDSSFMRGRVSPVLSAWFSLSLFSTCGLFCLFLRVRHSDSSLRQKIIQVK